MPLYVRLAVVTPLHTVGFAPSDIVGDAPTDTVIAEPAPEQVVVLFLTERVALYVATAAPPGTVNMIGLAGNAALVTSTNP